MTEPKLYDRDYFDRWYRGKGGGVGSRAALKRKVALAVSAAEYVLARPLRSVVDVGCGEGRWQPMLHDVRPKASYLGIDSSEYSVKRYGRRRNLRLGSFEELELHVFDRPFDLVVCSDVLHYLSAGQLRAGLGALSELVGGVALLDTFTGRDAIEGDMHDFRRRSAQWYRQELLAVGLVPIGLHLYVHAEIARQLDALDLPS